MIEFLTVSKKEFTFPTILPPFKGEPRQAAIKKWLDGHQRLDQFLPGIAIISEIIVKNINYINHDKFIAQLTNTCAEFNTLLSNSPYILWVAQNCKKLDEGCSDLWVAQLALEHGNLQQPQYAADTYRMANIIKPGTRILLLDDAAYSGTHVIQQLEDFMEIIASRELSLSNFTIYIGIPFISTLAKNKIEAFKKEHSLNLIILSHQTFPTVAELKLFNESNAYLKWYTYDNLNYSLTYFQHRFPDSLSTFAFLKTGDFLISDMKLRGAMDDSGEFYPFPSGTLNRGECLSGALSELSNLNKQLKPLVPLILSPYKILNYSKDGLISCIETHLTGERTQYPLPGELRELDTTYQRVKKYEERLPQVRANIMQLSTKSTAMPQKQFSHLLSSHKLSWFGMFSTEKKLAISELQKLQSKETVTKEEIAESLGKASSRLQELFKTNDVNLYNKESNIDHLVVCLHASF